MSTAVRKAHRPGVEWEFRTITYPPEVSRNVVRQFLVQRAEQGGWELARVRVAPDGTRRVLLRRKIIRQLRPTFWG